MQMTRLRSDPLPAKFTSAPTSYANLSAYRGDCKTVLELSVFVFRKREGFLAVAENPDGVACFVDLT